jgi:hypothetical protein
MHLNEDTQNYFLINPSEEKLLNLNSMSNEKIKCTIFDLPKNINKTTDLHETNFVKFEITSEKTKGIYSQKFSFQLDDKISYFFMFGVYFTMYGQKINAVRK